MYDPLRPKNPTDRQMRRVWGDTAWRRADDGSWGPTYIDGGSRVIVRQRAPDERAEAGSETWPEHWVVLLDGTLCRERDGSALTWVDRFAAGFDAVRMVRNDWHGPAHRFHPTLPWSQRQGFLMRPLTGSYISASGHPLNFDETPVAVVREWQWPCEGGWGVFVGSAQRHALQTIGMVMGFKSADEARAAADDEVGRWQKSREWDALNHKRNRRRGWWPPHD